MRKYFFQAVTKEGKQISGFVSSPSLDEAREKLKAGGLSILTLEEPKEDNTGKLVVGLKSFEFEATNKDHKKIRGTIEAEDRYASYKKLSLEYALEVDYIVDMSLPPSKKEAEKARGVDKSMVDRLQIEIKIAEKKEKKKKGGKKDLNNNEIQDAVEANEKERQFMMEKIDAVLSEVIPLLEENAEYIDSAKKRQIEERINLLMRLKHSNSVAHLKSLTKRILEQITTDEIFLQDTNIPPDLQEEIERRKNNFQSVGRKFDKAISKGLIDIQVQLARIDTKSIKETVSEIRLVEQLINIFYLMFVCLFIYCMGFLIFNLARGLLDVAVDQSEFYLNSNLIWYFGGFSFIWIISFYFFRFSPDINTWRDRTMVLGGTALALFLYTVQFPVIFYWL